MYAKFILWIIFSICIQEVFLQDDSKDEEDEAYENQPPLNCSTTDSIKNGRVSYSKGGLEGSVLTYHCGPVQYPYPVSQRVCNADGEWSRMKSHTGRLVYRATCKDVLCPAQLQLDNGNFWPRDQWFRINTIQSFSCLEGFTLYGSAHRNCTLSGDWTGDPPICDNHANYCDDPGIPPGSERSATHFRKDDKVTYHCRSGLDLLGSSERVCLESKEWSGSKPRCQGPYHFDSPSSVAKALAGSLAGAMDVISLQSKKIGEPNYGRSIVLSTDKQINIFILLDTSGSINKTDFEILRSATIALIKKLDSYDVKISFHVLSFATEVKAIVNIIDIMSNDVDYVIGRVEIFDYNSHGKKTGTNLHAALSDVNEKLSSLYAKNKLSNETQNIIIIETDGYSNIGPKPTTALAQIRSTLRYSGPSNDHTNEQMLDVYVFGVGKDAKREQLNSLASKKRGEEHVFILKDGHDLGYVFNNIISDKSVTMCGIAQENTIQTWDGEEAFTKPHYSKAYNEPHTKPWHVTLKSPEWGSKFCSGSILSPNWVLTAAHCFTKCHSPSQLTIKHGEGETGVENVICHPKYNIHGLKSRNVSEFYDYDVALVQTDKNITLSWKARPICLPCTVPASRALKKINSTCEDHKKELLTHEKTPAFFIHQKIERKQTHIHTRTQRPMCVEKARGSLKHPTNVTLEEFVTERFLCTGGTEGYRDDFTCKGDSGGALFLQRSNRFFQVGVVSWGTTDMCNKSRIGTTPPPEARDFYINLFEIIPWLKENLGSQMQFLA